MSLLKIDRHIAERIIATVIREDLKVPPGKANEMATRISTRIDASGADLIREGHRNEWRAIRPRPPHHGEDVTELVNKLRRKIPQADQDTLFHLWDVIYEYGREIPDAAVLNG